MVRKDGQGMVSEGVRVMKQTERSNVHCTGTCVLDLCLGQHGVVHVHVKREQISRKHASSWKRSRGAASQKKKNAETRWKLSLR